jgi:hypothetical protein
MTYYMQARTSRSSRTKYRYSVKLAAETPEIGKPLLTLSLTKPSYNAQATTKNCELFIYGDVYYIKRHEVVQSVEALRNKL